MILGRVEKGEDPVAEKKARIQAAQAQVRDSVETVVELFMERHVRPKLARPDEAQSLFDKDVLPRIGHKLIKEVTRRDVIELVDRVVDRGSPYRANSVLAAVRKLFNWSIERGIVDASPVVGIGMPQKIEQRDRILEDDEIKTVWGAFENLGYPFGPLFKLLLLTGQRRNEVAKMRWCDIDLDNRVWTLPKEMTKAHRLHTVPLSEQAIEIIETLPHIAGSDLVFTTGKGRNREKPNRMNVPVRGFGKAKARVDRWLGIPDWRLHDLRRTAASGMARFGTPINVLSKILNHASSGAQGGVTAIYNRYAYEDEKRIALEKWGSHVDHIVTGREAKVVPLHYREAINN